MVRYVIILRYQRTYGFRVLVVGVGSVGWGYVIIVQQ